MKVCVVGCGAVGSLFAAHLARLDDVEVWAYDLDERHCDAINSAGLRLSGLADFTSKLQASSDASKIPACDYGIVATKTYHTRSAIEATANIFKDGAVCSVQNGVGSEEIIAEYAPRVIRGTTFPAGRIVEPGHIQQDAVGQTWIGPFEPKPATMDEVELLAEALTRSGMETLAMKDARGAQWTKLVFNASTNPIGALTRLTHGRVCDQKEVRALVTGLVNEAVAVADKLGITLDSDPEKLIDHAREVAYDHKASMLQDVLGRRKTEVESLNGGIVRFGRETGVPTPLNEAIWALILGLEESSKRDKGETE